MTESFFHHRLGDFKCLAIRDGGNQGSADFLFLNAPPDELDKALLKHKLKRDQLPTNWTCWLVDTGGTKVLVDTGMGIGNPNGGRLLPLLEQAGYHAEDIDLVLLTHGHGDHLGGVTGSDGKSAFRRARYLIARREFDFWMEIEPTNDMYTRMAEFARNQLGQIENQLELVDGEVEIVSGIKMLPAYGHTPGHSVVQISTANENLLILADSVLHPIHLEHPDWYAGVDYAPEQMIETRRRLLERAARESLLVSFYHFDFPGLGYVEPVDGKWSWRSL